MIRWIFSERKLFGDTYSGLEYDYRGLVQVYVGLGDDNKAAEYMRRLSDWKAARDIEQTQRLLPISSFHRFQLSNCKRFAPFDK